MNKNNYYDLELFLDPAETDPAKLEELLKKKIGGWNKKSQQGNDVAPKFQDFVEKAKAWQKELGPPATVSQATLRLLADEARKERLNDLRLVIAEVERDGILEQHEWDYLLKTFGGTDKYFTEKTIKGETRFPITKTKVAQNSSVPKEPEYPPGVKIPDKDIMDKIDNWLEIVQTKPRTRHIGVESQALSIFDLVNMEESISAKILLDKANEMDEIWRRKASNKKTALNDDVLPLVISQTHLYKSRRCVRLLLLIISLKRKRL